jgi:hypothetical protein
VAIGTGRSPLRNLAAGTGVEPLAGSPSSTKDVHNICRWGSCEYDERGGADR